jgi:hypothetical protein
LVSDQYSVRPSGLKARPLLTVTPSAMRSSGRRPSGTARPSAGARLVDRAHPEPALRVGLAVVEALVGAGRRAAAASSVRSPLARIEANRPSRIASSSRPPGTGAQQPGSVGSGPVPVAARGGCQRFSCRPGDVAPVQRRFVGGARTAIRPAAPAARRQRLKAGRHQPGSTSIFIQASMRGPAQGAQAMRQAGSAMWMALLTWLTGSTQ